MLLVEPPSSPADLHFSIFGIPVRVHPFFWLVSLMLGMTFHEPIKLVIWVVAVFVSILIHELGHAVAAKLHGWQPWITLYGMGGLASYRPTYHSTRSQVLISLAGPGAGFLLIGLVMAAVEASGHRVSVERALHIPYWVFFEDFNALNLNTLIEDLLWINIFWGLVNLVPIFPLDGGQVAMELLTRMNPRDGMRQALWLSVFAAVCVAVAGGVLLQDWYIALFFAYLAYTSFEAIQRAGGRGTW